MEQCYVPGFRAEGAQVTVDYDGKYGFNYEHTRIHWRLEDSRTDVM